MTTEPILRPGLEGVIAAETRLCHIDGQAGLLIIAGYPLEELAGRASYEEVLHLLWHDRPPTADELAELRAGLAARRHLPLAAMELLRAAAARDLPIMDVLRIVAGALSLGLESEDLHEAAMTVVAAFPTIVAAVARLRAGQEPLAPREDLTHAANYLYMLQGREPEAEQTRALETYLNTVIEHGLNASTFAARVIISTRSDLIAAVVGALGALKGPLHGGAPGPALDMVFEIGRPEAAEDYLRAKLARGERLMGFGHRVYRVRDPRADALAAAAERFFASGQGAELYALARHVERVALELLAEHRPGRNLQTNVEFYTALLLHGLGLSTDLFTPTFAVGRVGGWTAHCFEQMAADRLIRPLSQYSGPRDRRWDGVQSAPVN